MELYPYVSILFPSCQFSSDYHIFILALLKESEHERGFSTEVMSATLSCHNGVVYLVQGSHAYESNNLSIGLKIKPSVVDWMKKRLEIQLDSESTAL